MESYLRYTLGLHVDIRAWTESKDLPDELRAEREYSLLEICGIKCLVITVLTSEFQLSTYLKQRTQLQEYCEYPFVLCFDRITSYQRKCLIESGQSFIVPENQLYMPFLGIALQEHFKAQSVSGKQLTAMAQYILLFFLYHQADTYYSKLDISKQLDISLMNVTRGVQELEEYELLVTKKKGRSSMVTMALPKRELYEKAYGYLRNPVQKRVYVKTESRLLSLPKSGKEALADKTHTAGTGRKIRAIEKREYLDTSDSMQTIDPDWDTDTDYIELEVWRYDPKRFGTNHTVDSISLALSFMGENCDVVEMEINKLLS